MIRVLLSALALLLCAGMVALGVWQLGRGSEKAARLAAFDAALQAPPVDLAQALQGDPAVPAMVSGRLAVPIDWPWLLLDNQRRDQQVGVRAYRLADPGEGLPLLVVEFGWLPLPADRSLPQPAPPADTMQVSGVLLSPPSGGLRLAQNPAAEAGAAVRLLTYLDTRELAAERQREVHPRVLRLDPALPVGFARDLQLLPNTLPPERHRAYAVQWFGLAAALLAIILIMKLRSRTQ